MHHYREVIAAAFNEGADARLAGKSRSANPYRNSDEFAYWLEWQKGWEEVHRHYGRLARWPVRRLPLRELVTA